MSSVHDDDKRSTSHAGLDSTAKVQTLQKKEKEYKIQKPYIIHRSANAIIVAGQNQMFKTERVSYRNKFNSSYFSLVEKTHNGEGIVNKTSHTRLWETSIKSSQSSKSSRIKFQLPKKQNQKLNNTFRPKNNSTNSCLQFTHLVRCQ